MSNISNQHIGAYLDYYCGLSISPEFAVLLRGNWGSGKSWFIRQYMEKNQEAEFLYVSLYGVIGFHEIEDAFFAQLHPILAHKGMKIAAKLLKGVVKTTIKIDFDEKKNDTLTLGGTLPSIDIPEYLTKLDGKILIFDDLERCGMPIYQILGYINQFVENNGLKVIILANEEEIIKADDEAGASNSARRYLTIKEKLIGKSFDIAADNDSAITSFILQVEDPNCRALLNKENFLIQMVFLMAGYGNLRHLRQALLDFSRFFELLGDDVNANRALMIHLLNLFLVISFELKKGSIHEEDIEELLTFRYTINKSNETKNTIETLRQKYSILKENIAHPISANTWWTLFRTGTINNVKLNEELKSSTYLSPEEEPAWRKLYFLQNLEDAEFSLLYRKVLRDFKETTMENAYEIVQVTGVLVYLSCNRLANEPVEQLIALGLGHLQTLAKTDQLDYYKLREFPGDHSHGLGYMAKGIPVFEDFLKKANTLLVIYEHDSVPKRGKEVFEIAQRSAKEFAARIDPNAHGNTGYVLKPILKDIDFVAFATLIKKSKNSDMTIIIDALEARYTKGYQHHLYEERPWLESIRDILMQYVNQSVDPITVNVYLLTYKILPTIEACIAALTVKK